MREASVVKLYLALLHNRSASLRKGCPNIRTSSACAVEAREQNLLMAAGKRRQI